MKHQKPGRRGLRGLMSNPNYPFVVISLNISKICAQCVHIEKTKLVLKSELKTWSLICPYMHPICHKLWSHYQNCWKLTNSFNVKNHKLGHSKRSKTYWELVQVQYYHILIQTRPWQNMWQLAARLSIDIDARRQTHCLCKQNTD